MTRLFRSGAHLRESMLADPHNDDPSQLKMLSGLQWKFAIWFNESIGSTRHITEEFKFNFHFMRSQFEITHYLTLYTKYY